MSSVRYPLGRDDSLSAHGALHHLERILLGGHSIGFRASQPLGEQGRTNQNIFRWNEEKIILGNQFDRKSKVSSVG